ncbi:hypothetical protein HYFRA_00012534 [Hymenoscyphus fraxineus]|uniref:Uncharacterized protein n=1 Tax=Hymenoscyphus fraxineus TaxID=746836 RepID=A0A9N9L7Z4_9HELO|nr:hypothetical protein HYFRA_00012534 [Hymenoscyphus fraxineus]
MGAQHLFSWRSQTTPARTTDTAATDEEPPADVDEPPDNRSSLEQQHLQPDFQKSTIQGRSERKESLLTKALTKVPETKLPQPEIQIQGDLSRRRSMISNASMASTAELTSDGGLTSPARTNTPSPPPPGMLYGSFAPYSLGQKTGAFGMRDSTHPPEIISVSPKAQVAAAPKKRCITFACGGTKNAAPKPTSSPAPPQQVPSATSEAPKPRVCKIQFACPGPKAAEKTAKAETEKKVEQKLVESSKKSHSRSPSMTRKSSSRHLQEPQTINRRRSQSPLAVRVKPKYIIADEKTLRSSDATRFHEFASDEPQEDDWILQDVEVSAKKMTINDTLKKENAIRKLGNEVEEEELEEEEEMEEDDDQITNYSEDEEEEEENDDEEQEEDDEDDEDDDGVSDGNETDNEAGFADSDDESDAAGDFAFWTPGRNMTVPQSVEASAYRASAHRTHRAASASSIDSVSYMQTMSPKKGKKSRRRAIKIRPGTPELPDSTDFVCGTLDEDRPMENAYIACIEARKYAKHKQTPQDIDPSFPTSDPEDEEDDEDLVQNSNNSEEVWIHGKFEESDHEGRHRTARRKSPMISPRRMHSPPPGRRLHSPPPPKQRHRSPPPRKLFGHSPKPLRSPPPPRALRSPMGTPNHSTTAAIKFGELATRPELTHTKSLPRAPNAFGRQYKASRMVAAAGNNQDSDAGDGHVRGAIDIVKGLESKRLRRKEKFLQKHCKARKEQPERKMATGKGAERMRQVGLNMAGKTVLPTVPHNPYMMSA